MRNDTDTTGHVAMRGRCHPAEGRDPDIWHPIGTGPAYWRAVARAKEECRRCPLNTACREDALTLLPSDGIWGGLTTDELVVMARGRGGYRTQSWPDGRDDLTIEHIVSGRGVPGAAEIDRAHAAIRMFRTGEWTKRDLAERLGTHEDMIRKWLKRAEAGEPLVQRKHLIEA